MGNILEGITNPEKIQKLNNNKIEKLAKEIREFLIDNVSKSGGHLASNLGVVELTLALFKNFNFEEDRIIWDVGHQSYVYKMLTGRRHKFSTLRQFNGLSGFPKREESKYDYFDTGHSSTSLSAASGMARARDIWLSFSIIIILLLLYPISFNASIAIPPVNAPSPITATTL